MNNPKNLIILLLYSKTKTCFMGTFILWAIFILELVFMLWVVFTLWIVYTFGVLFFRVVLVFGVIFIFVILLILRLSLLSCFDSHLTLTWDFCSWNDFSFFVCVEIDQWTNQPTNKRTYFNLVLGWTTKVNGLSFDVQNMLHIFLPSSVQLNPTPTQLVGLR